MVALSVNLETVTRLFVGGAEPYLEQGGCK